MKRPGTPEPAEAARVELAVFAPPLRPVATWCLIALMAAIFLGPEQWVHVRRSVGLMSPSAATLYVLGGLDGTAVFQDGEAWRMVTAALLHGSPTHLLFNSLALVMAGRFLEPLVGRAWYLALFVVGAVGGSAMSMAVNEPHIVSVGASGAIMALLSAAFVASLRLPRGAERTHVQVALGQMLVPSLLPLAAGLSGVHIDYGAHLGGALTGAVAGGLLLAVWRRDEAHPGGRALAVVLTLAGLFTAAWGARAVLRTLMPAALG